MKLKGGPVQLLPLEEGYERSSAEDMCGCGNFNSGNRQEHVNVLLHISLHRGYR